MFLNTQQTQRVLDTMKGKIPEDEVLKDMKAFFKENFSVEIIAYLTDRLNDGKIKERFSRASREHDLNEGRYGGNFHGFRLDH